MMSLALYRGLRRLRDPKSDFVNNTLCAIKIELDGFYCLLYHLCFCIKKKGTIVMIMNVLFMSDPTVHHNTGTG